MIKIYPIFRQVLSINSLQKSIIASVIFLFVFISTSTGTLAQNWPKFGFNNEMTSFNPKETRINKKNVSKLEMKWGIGYNDGWFSTIYRSPAIYNGKLFTSQAGGKLSAYNTKTGKLLWQFGDGNDGWAPQPVVSKGVLYYLEKTFPTYLYAVDVKNGKQIWKAPIGFELGFSGAAEAVLTVDEQMKTVYLVENKFLGDGKLFALSTKNGQVRWYKSKAKDGMAFRGDHILLKNKKIYAIANRELNHFDADQIVCINAKTQKILRYYDRPKPEEYYEISGLIFCGKYLIAVFSDRDDVFMSKSVVVAYNENSKNILWKRKIFHSGVTGSIACNPKKNYLYIPTNPYLYAVKAQTGNLVWRYTGFSDIYTPSIANEIIYFISDTNMYAIDEKNRKVLLTYPLGYEGGDTTQVAICNGMVYFSGNGGTADLFALSVPIK